MSIASEVGMATNASGVSQPTTRPNTRLSLSGSRLSAKGYAGASTVDGSPKAVVLLPGEFANRKFCESKAHK